VIQPELRQRLTRLASLSIEHGVRQEQALPVDSNAWATELCEMRSSFVTLHKHGELRGCIGSLVATQPLVQDVSHHAFCAAFRDPRFPPVVADELESLHVHISVLSIPSAVSFDNEADLLDVIQPGRDGLILREGTRQATFLPAVWENLPEPVQFLAQLKLKAGLDRNYWSDKISIERYTTESW
jgi:AmmeMemoRadiSam system protein A